MKGVCISLWSQLVAEIGDITRFMYKGSLTTFSEVDPRVN